ncbi:MAG: hypothetical protein JJU06_05710 [Ectothiorhodospiraceae bacterium]|nr:hypothetical protein [Ectothiorhodospiraceae bacterium]MCH8502929.1 hypothetical protein [Ectothiorhodospiraceae bacterium]
MSTPSDRKLLGDLRTLIETERRQRLPRAPRRGLFPRSRVEAVPEDRPEGGPGGGAGIASPLTEPDYEAREYYETQFITSSDGLFVLELAPIRKLVMEDANANEVEFDFADPEGEEEG